MRLRNPALDGLRGVAVLAVVVFHAGGTWLPGGWLGVDVFFVLSGFLITSLVINEWARDRRCDLRRFWSRRARRLLPATVVLLAALAGFAGARRPRAEVPHAARRHVRVARVGRELAVRGTTARPTSIASPHRRCSGTCGASRSRRSSTCCGRCCSCCCCSCPGGGPHWSRPARSRCCRPSPWPCSRPNTARAYFGTDTHAHGLLLGAAAALLCARVEVRGRAVAAGGFLGAAAVVAGFCRLQGNDELAFRGGIFAVGIATVLVVLAVSAADARGPSSARCRAHRSRARPAVVRHLPVALAAAAHLRHRTRRRSARADAAARDPRRILRSSARCSRDGPDRSRPRGSVPGRSR